MMRTVNAILLFVLGSACALFVGYVDRATRPDERLYRLRDYLTTESDLEWLSKDLKAILEAEARDNLILSNDWLAGLSPRSRFLDPKMLYMVDDSLMVSFTKGGGGGGTLTLGCQPDGTLWLQGVLRSGSQPRVQIYPKEEK